jgi:hypothetical protein
MQLLRLIGSLRPADRMASVLGGLLVVAVGGLLKIDVSADGGGAG